MVGQRSPTGEIGNILDVSWSHNALVEDGDIDEQLVKSDILLRVGADQVVELKTRNGEDRLVIELGVI